MSRQTRMAREILQQPEVVRRTLLALQPLRSKLWVKARKRRRVLFAARGSSQNACDYGRYLIPVYNGIETARISPSVATYYRIQLDLSDAIVVCVSQSGETSEIVDTARWARECGALTVGITNDAGSSLNFAVDLCLVTRAGPETAIPATKTYLSQLIAMTMVATALGADEHALDNALARLPAEIDRLLCEERGVDDAVSALGDGGNLMVVGGGLLIGTARELALKLEEASLWPVKGYSVAELRHGPVTTVDDQTRVVVVAPPGGRMAEPMRVLADDLRSMGATVIGLGGDPEFSRLVDLWVPGPEVSELLAPIGVITPGQLMAERLGRHLGLNPDRPRRLDKVTVTDPPPSWSTQWGLHTPR